MAFTPIVSYDDIYSRIYEEIIDEITREQTSLLDRAISTAIQEVKGYLSRFDLTQLFGDGTNNATVQSTWLNTICVDVAVYRLVLLGNPNIKFEVAKETYDSARDTLKSIQKGFIMPVDDTNKPWPYKDTTGETAPQGDSVYIRSNPKRRNNY